MENFLVQAGLAVLDTFLELLALAAVIYARRKFSPGLFKKLVGFLVAFIVTSAFLHLVKLASILNPISLGAQLNADPIFSTASSLVSSGIIAVLGYALINLAKAYGFADNKLAPPFQMDEKK